jgi:galacturan 1,4-alpha-galacturonidase
MTIIHSENVLLQDTYVNNTSHNSNGARNTDGLDTMFSNNIHINRWTVVNGDDSISLKANSTNILITNCTFYNGLGIALGSIGQYLGAFETIENVTVSDLIAYKTLHGAYIKTWTGQQVGYPPNGGGGGLGCTTFPLPLIESVNNADTLLVIKNITFKNFKLQQTRGAPFSITQCTTFSGVAGDCNSSLFQLSDITISNVTGSTLTDPIASYQCSAAAPCHDISMFDVDLSVGSGSTVATGWNCSSVENTFGFNCTGTACLVGTATGSC